jgi:hypothetical protein
VSLSTAIIDLLRLSFADAARWPKWPKPLHLVQGVLLVEGGTDISDAARIVGTTVTRLMEVATGHDPIEMVLRVTEADLKAEAIERLRRNVGQLVLGRAAEIAFQEIFEAGIDRREFSMKDVRESRTNTDFRLLNGGGRPLYRFNVKFAGSVFRRGAELVNLPPSDCFPLATYKILAALQEQEKEHLPYVFAVVAVPDLNASAVAEAISEQEVRPLAMLFASPVVTRKRDFEDWLVDRIVEARSFAFTTAYGRIRQAGWYILSARRANDLMHRLLFERVFALRVPGFTRQFPAAEVDMHFSLPQELVTLRDFLRVLRADGPGRVTTMLERGTY